MYKGIIFDLDGTLSNSVPCIMKCSELVHKAMGIPWDPVWQKSVIGKPLYQCALEVTEESRVQEYLDYNKRLSEEYMPKMIVPFEGAVELVADLKKAGIKMCIATSRLKWGAVLSCEKIGISDYLERIIAVEDTKTHKPEPEPALLAMETMGLSPENCVFIGDSPYDIGCGHNAGTESIAVGWGVTEKAKLLAANPTHYCETMADLRKILLP